jgi:hypothetical protein
VYRLGFFEHFYHPHYLNNCIKVADGDAHAHMKQLFIRFPYMQSLKEEDSLLTQLQG